MSLLSNKITYGNLSEINKAQLLKLLNSVDVRKHLMPHPNFTEDSLDEWLEYKTNIDKQDGYCVKVINYNGELAGWCGIQPDDSQPGLPTPEIAVILAKPYWGIGKWVYRDLISWAKFYGHEQVLIHFFSSRKRYRFLEKHSLSVSESLLNGQVFTTYRLSTRNMESTLSSRL